MLLVALVFLLCSSLSDAVPVIYNRTGGEVVIFPGSADFRITAITWKHNEDIAVEWYGGDPSAYRHFRGFATLDIWTGVLNISGLTRDHSGSYTAEINNKVADTTEVRIISPVPKPTVSKRCDAEMTYCTLTCEGNTTDAEPVECSWRIFDAHNYRKGQQFNLTKYDHDPWYECEMKNPISSETSERFSNPFSSRNRMFTVISVLCVILLLIVLFVVICIYVKRKSNKGEEDKGSVDGKEYKWTDRGITKLLAVVSNGVGITKLLAVVNNDIKNVNLVAVVSNGNTVSVEETSDQTKQTSSVVPDINEETAVMNACETSNPDKTSENPNDEPEISFREEEIKVQVHRSEAPESNDQTATTTSESKEALTSFAEKNNEAATDSQDQETSRNDLKTAASPETATDSQDQETSRNDLKTAASPETEESSEESNVEETTRPLLEEPDLSISVSA